MQAKENGMKTFLFKGGEKKPGMMAYICNPSYSGGVQLKASLDKDARP
jgi:hypothetical protein